MKKLMMTNFVRIFLILMLSAWGVQQLSLPQQPARSSSFIASGDVSLAGVSPDANPLGITTGAHIRPVIEYDNAVSSFNNLAGKEAGVIMYFLDWGSLGTVFDPYLLQKLKEIYPTGGPAIMLTWQPINGRANLDGQSACDQDYNITIPLDSIIAGKCDNYIRRFAQAIKARPERFLLRFAHEMNITDTPWWPGHFGQDASTYIAMWQHVYQVFTSQGVTNAEWVWSPNYASNPPDAWNNIHNYYPGDAYVNWIGLSGYSWYNASPTPVPWKSFQTLFDSVLKDMTCRYAKPQLIAEIGTVEGSGGKANWILDAYAQIPNYPFLRGAFWFNDFAYADPTRADFRVTTSSDISSGNVTPLEPYTTAYRLAVANSVYISSLPSLSSATPPQAYCGNGEAAIIRVGPSAIMIRPGEQAIFSISAMLISSDKTVTYQLPAGVGLTGSLAASTLTAPWDDTTLTVFSSSSTPLGNHTITISVGGQPYSVALMVASTIHKLYLPAINR